MNDAVNTHTNTQVKRKCQQYRKETVSVTSRIYSEYSRLWKASSMQPAILACICIIVRVHVSYSKVFLLFDTTNVFLLWNTKKCHIIYFCCIPRVRKLFTGVRFLGCFCCHHCSLIVGIQPSYSLQSCRKIMNILTWEIAPSSGADKRHMMGSVRNTVQKILLACDSGRVQHFASLYFSDILRRFPVDFRSSI